MNGLLLGDLFQHVYTVDTLEAIEHVFTDKRLNYKPGFQRDYVWPPQKGTSFIETILLHSEFPPIVIFERNNVREVIDGRQRCETIDRFMKDELTLRASGLEHLWTLADMRWSQLPEEMRERIRQTKMRVITVRFKMECEANNAMEMPLKRELFRRYNLGLTPLRREEVYKAQYLKEEITMYFAKRFQQDPGFYDQVRDVFDHRAKSPELLMQTIRQVLVLYRIPINKFSTEGDDIVNKYYDFLSSENPDNEQVREIFNRFRDKITLLTKLKLLVGKETKKGTGLLYECLYWAMCVLESKNVSLEQVNRGPAIDKLIRFVVANIKLFEMERSNHYSLKRERYQKTAGFFSQQFKVDFSENLKSETFLVAHKERIVKYMKERVEPGLERTQFTKNDASSNTIRGILSLMSRNKFDLRPPYQRKEVISVVKASSLMETILMNFSLHPIFVYVNKDGVHEVIDGQQRIFAILAFMREKYMSPSGVLVQSKNHGFRLRLRSGMMQELDGKRFEDLPVEYQDRIRDFKLHIIEIRHDKEPNFKPEELFKRLNDKPFPIKEHSFEFWNAYVNPEIIEAVKQLRVKNGWLYLRKDNSRMYNEELLMYLIYLEYATRGLLAGMGSIREVLSVYYRDGAVHIQFKNRVAVTRILENDLQQQGFLDACKEFETGLLAKLKALVCYRSEQNRRNTDETMAEQLDEFLHTSSMRTAMHFWLLWILLRGITIQTCFNHRDAVLKEMDGLVEIMYDVKSLEEFDRAVTGAWSRLAKCRIIPMPPGDQRNSA